MTVARTQDRQDEDRHAPVQPGLWNALKAAGSDWLLARST